MRRVESTTRALWRCPLTTFPPQTRSRKAIDRVEETVRRRSTREHCPQQTIVGIATFGLGGLVGHIWRTDDELPKRNERPGFESPRRALRRTHKQKSATSQKWFCESMTVVRPKTEIPPTPVRRKRLRRWNRLRHFVNHQAIAHEVLVIAVSCEVLMALILCSEVLIRIAFAKDRSPTFWALIVLDSVSILTIVPQISYVSLLRLGRLVYASVRLTALLDRLSCRSRNPAYLIGIFPLVVPLLAAAVFAIEKRTTGSPIHTYVDAIVVCLTFSLSLGNVRPTSPWAMAICGALFIAGVVLIGICTTAISARYAKS